MSWLKEVIGTEKAIIAMCHMQAMPGDPGYDGQKGMDWVIKKMYDDLITLQNGGVDSVMFSNEFSLPYMTKVDTITVASMATAIGELKRYIKIPFGVNVLWDGQKHAALILYVKFTQGCMPAISACGIRTLEGWPGTGKVLMQGMSN